MRNKSKWTLLMAAVGAAFVVLAFDPAHSQDMRSGTNSGMMRDGADHDTMSRGMMQKGTDQNMMDHGMMQCMKDDKASTMMDHHSGGMMMGSGMMGSGMMQGGTGASMTALFGSRVRPIMNLSEADVRAYLAARLDQLNNKRLKIGEVKSDDSTVTADIVTVDNSLVQRLKVNRHTGAIEYES